MMGVYRCVSSSQSRMVLCVEKRGGGGGRKCHLFTTNGPRLALIASLFRAIGKFQVAQGMASFSDGPPFVLPSS